MFLLRRPSSGELDQLARSSSELPLSYGPVEISASALQGFSVDHARMIVGRGEQAFARAKAAFLHQGRVTLEEKARFGRGRGKLPVRRGSLRGARTFPPGQPLSLLAVPEALRHVGLHARPRPARGFSADLGRGLDPDVQARRRRNQGVLLGLRVEPVRGHVAGRSRSLDPARFA
jgi:hypothetical protein